ncbi:hypothetical protein BCV69DRAFT_284185 [Microstroma glucosiphilum]|uniref:BZIP domain-containing protein n=1 Tax=Pseudomicrostroma glucosiphilum TaxID=1684307 RepID=A0A316U2L2_9BASI|nr:hypothetical protein BCV69DRAFT_284185 [Pseudomicrostroma glucosiphilum]PWN19556.1 hypothetical protein BCV69DRAFT_284185 [Pseudomicrostroma glucosiphilum]
MAATSTSPYPIPFPNKVKGGSPQYGLPSNAIASSSFSPSSSASSSSNDSLSGSPPPSAQQQASAAIGGNRVKSSAAKRASAKAAAATKKAAAAARGDEDSRTSRAPHGEGSSSRSTAAASPTPGPDAKGDWVVPQRAKPGRKPSQEEPLTKRQAQNRASQRAFRERKQSHVATLEAKVAAYEEEKLTRDAREEKAQRKLRADNAALTEENAALKAKVKELELAVQTLKSSEGSGSSSRRVMESARPCQPGTCSEVGCRAPSHEGLPAQRLKRPLPSRKNSTGQVDYNGQQYQIATSPSRSNDNTSRFGAMTIAASRPLARPDLINRPAQQTVSFWSTTELSSPVGAQSSHHSAVQKLQREPSPDLMASSSMDMDRDCGFCTDATPCICRGEAILDLTGMDASSDDDRNKSLSERLDNTWMEGVDTMGKIEEETGDDYDGNVGGFTVASFGGGKAPHKEYKEGLSTVAANPTTLASVQDVPIRPAVSISSLLSSRTKAPLGKKLWNTTTPALAAPTSAPTPSTQASISRKSSSKLWWTSPASAQTITTSSMTSFVPAAGGRPAVAGGKKETLADALCSGDPANCPACGTDPVLAAFCEAVADDGAISEASSFSSIGPSISISRRGSTADRPTDVVFEDQDDPMSGKVPLGSSSTLRYPSGTSMSPPAPFSLPLPYRNASSASVIPTLASLERHGYTIPDAFKQIRSHPAFPKWQGGLNLLADVVSGRAPTQGQGQTSPIALGGTSPPFSTARKGLARRGAGTGTASGGLTVAEERKARHPSVEIGPSLQRKTCLMESTDRDVMSDHDHDHVDKHDRSKENNQEHDESHEARPSTSDAAGPSFVPLSSLSRHEDGATRDGHHGHGHGHGHGHKRRRLYVENDRVEEALRMLDGGVIGSMGTGTGTATATGVSMATSRSLTGLIPCGECPCPCPWAQQPSTSTSTSISKGQHNE